MDHPQVRAPTSQAILNLGIIPTESFLQPMMGYSSPIDPAFLIALNAHNVSPYAAPILWSSSV